MTNATTLMGCVGDQYAETLTTRLVLELQSSCKRNAAMLRNDVVRDFGLLPAAVAKCALAHIFEFLCVRRCHGAVQ